MAYTPSIATNIVKCDNYTTPQQAFDDLCAFKPLHLTKIYDPFYNDGKAQHYLKQAFPDCDVIHEDKDAFTWMPEYDIIITNPPFTLKTKVLKWLMTLDKPFMVLLPINQVCNKGFRAIDKFQQFQYIIPNGRYNFEIEGKNTKSNWFNVIWYCYKCNLPNEVNYII